MIRLRFGGISQTYDVSLGPSRAFRVAGNFIRHWPGGEVAAMYRNHQWQVGKDHYSRYDCTDPCAVHFEDAAGIATSVFGPFRALLTADGTMYADDQLFAKFIDETVNWHSFELETYWPVLIISAV